MAHVLPLLTLVHSSRHGVQRAVINHPAAYQSAAKAAAGGGELASGGVSGGA